MENAQDIIPPPKFLPVSMIAMGVEAMWIYCSRVFGCTSKPHSQTYILFYYMSHLQFLNLRTFNDYNKKEHNHILGKGKVLPLLLLYYDQCKWSLDIFIHLL
jgi:hypothetical protein